jgi:hypothetical protein
MTLVSYVLLTRSLNAGLPEVFSVSNVVVIVICAFYIASALGRTTLFVSLRDSVSSR